MRRFRDQIDFYPKGENQYIKWHDFSIQWTYKHVHKECKNLHLKLLVVRNSVIPLGFDSFEGRGKNSGHRAWEAIVKHLRVGQSSCTGNLNLDRNIGCSTEKKLKSCKTHLA